MDIIDYLEYLEFDLIRSPIKNEENTDIGEIIE